MEWHCCRPHREPWAATGPLGRVIRYWQAQSVIAARWDFRVFLVRVVRPDNRVRWGPLGH